MNPFIAGALINVAGGFLMQGAANRAARDAEKRNRAYLEESKNRDLSKLRKSAEKAGFNPLTALRSGAGNFQSNTAIMPSMSGYQFAVEAMGQGIQSAIQWKQTYAERALDTMLKTYQVKSMQADIALTQAQLKNLGVKSKQTTAMEVPLLDSDGTPMLDDEGQPMFMHALNQEVQPMWIAVRNPVTNKVFGYPNPELADMGPAEFATFLGLTGLFEKHAADGSSFSWKGLGIPAMPRFNRGVKFKGDNGQLSWPKDMKPK